MAESKRIFNAGKMNRDLDDRLVPPGEYRDALNVGIGRSEGSDVGAVENLKGNELITGQTIATNSTTIGSIRDQANDKIYWFTTSATEDAIYEYDASDGMVRTILKDSVARANVKPTCVPDFTTQVNDPDSDTNSRPDITFNYATPVGGCTNSMATNYNASATFDDGSCTFAPPPMTSDPVALITGPGVGTTSGSAVSLSGATSTPGTDTGGTATTINRYVWTTSSAIPGYTVQTQDSASATFDVTAPSADGTVNVSLTVHTAAGTMDTVDAAHPIVYSATPPSTFTFTGASAGSGPTGTTVSGAVGPVNTTEGVSFTPSFTSMVAIDSPTTMRWLTLPTATPMGLPSGVTLGAVMGTIGSSTAVNVSLTGSYTPTQNESVTITWSGGSLTPTTMSFGPISYFAMPQGFLNLPAWSTSALTSATGFTSDSITPSSSAASDQTDLSAYLATLVGVNISGLRRPNTGVNAGDTGYILGTIGSTNYSVAGTMNPLDPAFPANDWRMTITGVTAI